MALGGLALDNPRELREMAEWYRGMAEVGHTDARAWRIGFADYLDKRAAEIELVQERAES